MLQNPELYPLFIDILLSESLRTPKNSKIANIFYSSVCISLFLTNKDDTNKQVFASFLEYYVHID